MTGETWGLGRVAEALGMTKPCVSAMVLLGHLPKPDGQSGGLPYWNDGKVGRMLESWRKGGGAGRLLDFREICGIVPGLSWPELKKLIAQGVFPEPVRTSCWKAVDVYPLLPGLREVFAGVTVGPWKTARRLP